MFVCLLCSNAIFIERGHSVNNSHTNNNFFEFGVLQSYEFMLKKFHAKITTLKLDTKYQRMDIYTESITYRVFYFGLK